MTKFKRRTKGRTIQWPNLNERQKDEQHNDQIYTKDKGTNNDLQNTMQKTNDWATSGGCYIIYAEDLI